MADAVIDWPDWSKLPEDLLLLILHRLTSIPDLLRSSVVCTSWFSAVRELRHQHCPLRHTPWLMLHHEVDGTSAAKFYSLTERRFYTVPLPDNPPLDHCVLLGSSHGWLIVADDRSDIFLLNPITGARIRDLPPTSTLDYIEAVYDEEGSLQVYQIEEAERAHYAPHEIREFCYHKAVLSSRPSDEHYAVMVTAWAFTKLAFARAGDKKWTTILTDTIYQDIAFHSGEFYLMTCTGLVRVWDLHGNQKASFHLSLLEKGIDYVNLDYMVPCPSGDLFQIRSEFMDPDFSMQYTIHNVSGLKGEIVQDLNSLANYAFFVGSSNSLCLSCTDFPELRPKCVYFIVRGGVGIYDLENGRIQYISTIDQSSECLPPTWVIPSF